MSILSILPSLNRLSDQEEVVNRSPVDNTATMRHGDWFAFRLNINHIMEGFKPGRGYDENPIRRMVMSGRFDFQKEHNIRDVGVWYDSTTGRYFGFFYFDMECRMYRLRRTDEVED
jgi:hypothetical protein